MPRVKRHSVIRLKCIGITNSYQLVTKIKYIKRFYLYKYLSNSLDVFFLVLVHHNDVGAVLLQLHRFQLAQNFKVSIECYAQITLINLVVPNRNFVDKIILTMRSYTAPNPS